MAERSIGYFPLQLIELDELHNTLKKAIRLRDKREKVRESLSGISDLEQPQWADIDALQALAADCRAVLDRLNYIRISSSINRLLKFLTDFSKGENVHPLAEKLLTSIKARDAEAYGLLHEQVVDLSRQEQKMRPAKKLLEKLASTCPDLASALKSCHDRQRWILRLDQLDLAWGWAQGTNWLDGFLQTDLESHFRHSADLDTKIRKAIAELASVKAWKSCFELMGTKQRQHLVAWKQAMVRLGKGTGKYAHIHRKDAKKSLNQCRSAVPAWIMPLHRVYETVNAGAGTGLFDVIIVDEASQCGPESLPLLCLGKRILVVGDDQQISPEAIGVNYEQVRQYMDTWLHDFDHPYSFGPETSLFDHCQRLFSNRISLREHFRCMPEIIRFSNRLCYQTNPLIPLRQYPPDRLEPLKSVFVAHGLRDGSGQRVVNQPEAKALAVAVAKCCADERYKEMTMGVIVLQGTAQASLISDVLRREIGAKEMEQRRIVCGNSLHFQGGERDVIFLSMVAAPNARFRAMTSKTDQQRFNVAASRAREQMWLFHSVTSNDLGQQCLRRKLLDHFQNPDADPTCSELDIEAVRSAAEQTNRTVEDPPAPFDSWFEVDVALHLAAQKYRVVPKYPVAGGRIDLVVQGGRAQLAIECDGDCWHGSGQFTADLERQKQLERCGWQFFRIRESRYYANPGQTLQPLWTLLERLGILPGVG